MSLADALLSEFDREMAITRRLLERVPEDRFSWRPHARSMSLGELAMHVASLPSWGAMTLSQSEFHLLGGSADAAPPKTELLELFDRNVSETRAALVGKLDAEMAAPWVLKQKGHVLFTMPRAAAWRNFVLNHLVHHRGQLSVYLRLNEVPVPSMYGPSADEAPAF